MAVLAFGQLWLNQMSDPSVGLGLSLNDIEYDPVIDVASTQRAGGNFDADTTPGMQMVAKVTLDFATDAQKRQLMAWYAAGTPLCLRAPDGTKFFGVIASGGTFAPQKSRGTWAVPFTVEEYTDSEAV